MVFQRESRFSGWQSTRTRCSAACGQAEAPVIAGGCPHDARHLSAGHAKVAWNMVATQAPAPSHVELEMRVS
jgi:hypothetical protein